MLGLISYFDARAQRKATNKGSSASNPGQLQMSDGKLRRLCPSLYCRTGLLGFLRCFLGNGWGWRYHIRDVLVHGDSRAAVVVGVSPLLVGCYCDDIDGVCILRFNDDLALDYNLRRGDHLLTVLNSYVAKHSARSNVIAPDIVQGDRASCHYVNFWPLVADFLSEDTESIQARKKRISDKEFSRCLSLADEHIRRFAGAARDGRPDRSIYAVQRDLRGLLGT